jgi:hypothetical protein
MMMRSNSKQPFSLTGEKAAESSRVDLRTSGAGGATEMGGLEWRAGRRAMETWEGGTVEVRVCGRTPGRGSGILATERCVKAERELERGQQRGGASWIN